MSMQIRKWLALLVSAALALSLLAGCGNGSKALSDVIADLLSGQYANVTVEIDPDLEGDLRQAVHEGETDAEIRAALEKILGSGVSFRLIGDGQQGDSAWNLILYPGSDPDAAARSAFTEWNKVFGSLPRDGQYTAQIAMIETENGYAILVKATVDKAASRDDDDEPEEQIPESGYKETNTNTYTVYNEKGLTNVLFGGDDDSDLAAARNSGFEGVTIELAAGSYSVDSTFTTTFKGTLKGESPAQKATINITGGNGLFTQIGEYSSGPENNGTVENITFGVQTNITNTYADGGNCFAGAVAGSNNGTITNCTVTINGSISATDGSNCFAGAVAGSNNGNITDCTVTINDSISATDDSCCAGAVAGLNNGTITDCTVTINDSISATGDSMANAGGLVGWNYGTITDCTVTINGSISATSNYIANAGGIAGGNDGEIKENSQVTLNSGGSIQATSTSVRVNASASAGGLVGQNSDTVDGTYSGTGCITAKAKKSDSEYYTASVPNDDDKNPNIDTQGNARAGTEIGFDNTAKGPVGSL